MSDTNDSSQFGSGDCCVQNTSERFRLDSIGVVLQYSSEWIGKHHHDGSNSSELISIQKQS